MTAATPVPLSPKSQESFIAYYTSLQNLQGVGRSQLRSYFESMDLAYQREVDATREQADARAANELGDVSRYQNLVVPVVMPQIEAAVTYQASVFLTGYPTFGVVANSQYMDEALQLETILEDQSKMGAWEQQLILFFLRGFKYNLSPIEVSWESVVTTVIETDLTKSVSQGIPKRVIWEGNKLRSLDPYNTFMDTRVAPTQVHTDGEFAGYTEFMSRIKLKKYISELPDKLISNIADAFASGSVTGSLQSADSRGFYVPCINNKLNSNDLLVGGTNWLSWAGQSTTRNKNIDYKDGYEVTTLYCRILPSEFSLTVPDRNTPQIYKLIIVNHQHIIYAEKQTNAHNMLPILFGQPYEDGLGYQTKSLTENALPFQALSTAYMTSIISSRRRAISDRCLFDPSRISAAAINSSNPSAKIPVRPAAFGKNLAEAVYPFPYREDQAASSMQQISMIIGLAITLAGQNQASQGQFVKGNKTLHEYESVMQNASGRDQRVAILLENQVLTPLKRMLLLNILQYQGGTELYNSDKDKPVTIDPVALRKAVMEFTVTDGLIPSSKAINGETFGVALQVLGSSPALSASYDIPKLFSYLMKTQGAKINEFEKPPEQVAYEQALGSWQSIQTLAVEKGNMEIAKQAGPQPLPEQFGYNPSGAPVQQQSLLSPQ